MTKAWFRTLACAMSVTALGAGLVVGCGDDDEEVTPGLDAGRDGTADVNTPTPDSSTPDSAMPEAGPPDLAKLIVLHASPEAPAFRLCYGLKVGIQEIVPNTLAAPDTTANAALPYPGIFPGTGGTSASPIDLEPQTLVPYVVDAEKIKNDVATTADAGAGTARGCDELLGRKDGGVALVEGTDYFKLPEIPKGTFAKGTTVVLALTGCPKGITEATRQAKCGSDYTEATGNLKITHPYLDRKAPATGMGAQAVHVSQPVEAMLGTLSPNGVVPYFQQPDAGPVPLTGPIKFGQVGPAAPGSITGATQQTVFGIGLPLADGGVQKLAPTPAEVPLGLIQASTTGSTMPADYFKDGKSYGFIIVGDLAVPYRPATDGGLPNGKGFHFLAYPSDP